MPAVTQVELTNFRSYKKQIFKLHPEVTLVAGPNASGKTNLLESLYVLSSAKSFRSKDNELIHHKRDFYRIVAGRDGQEFAIGYQKTDTGSKKKITHNGAEKSLTSHIGSLSTVLFEPNDLLIIYGAPEQRRRYLDFVLTQTSKPYLRALNSYRRVLHQRNKLLSDWRGDETELFAWNVKMSEYAAEVVEQRVKLLAFINKAIESLYTEISGSKQLLAVEYKSDVKYGKDYANSFLQALSSSLGRDAAAGFTTIGPHRDDLRIVFKGSDVNHVASRGEMRTIVLALKLAELQYASGYTENPPLLLLDDVFSELDERRRAYLLKSLGGCQTLITTTNADNITSKLAGRFDIINTKKLKNA